jgi:pimeloyl-ACP methyl ester carboxylesterase
VRDASSLFRPTADDRVHDALAATPGGLEAWNEAETRLGVGQGGAETTWDALAGMPMDGADYDITRGVVEMDAATQAAFLRQYGQTSDIPLGILRPVDTVPADRVLLTVDANPIAQGSAPASFATVVHDSAVDGLADSTALPPIGGLEQRQWRATLDQLAAAPPSSLAELRADLQQLSGGAISAAALDTLATNDANALPALLNLVQDRPPQVTFDGALNLSILPGGRGVPATYRSISYDPLANVAVVDTSLSRLLRDPVEQARIAETYGVADLPMTIRIPLPNGAPTDWSNPTTDDFALLNQQLRDIGSAAVFLHGFQSDRRVWQTDMQRWMDLSPQPTIGIAVAGMGSEGGFLGSGDSPLTAKQYAFQTMEALDALGLYGKDLVLYGHSMGGAAVLQMGLATDRMVAAGADRPAVDYVLLEPAPSGDSVPFLTGGFPSVSTLINAQTDVGAAGWLGNIASQITNWLGSGVVVNHLIPGAPGYIQDVHEGFARSGGFDQLKATAQGLVLQAEPDPAEVRAFLAGNHVLVVAGAQDRIVSTAAVQGIFDGHVYEVPGNHYAHLPSSIPEQDHFGDVEERVREFLQEPVATPTAGPGWGGGGIHQLR